MKSARYSAFIYASRHYHIEVEEYTPPQFSPSKKKVEEYMNTLMPW